MKAPAFITAIANLICGRWPCRFAGFRKAERYNSSHCKSWGWPEFRAAITWCRDSWLRPASTESSWEQGPDR